VIGITACAVTKPAFGRQTRPWLVFGVLAAIAPDLDVVAGIVAGEVNRYHHGASHSVFAALLFGGLAGVVCRAAGKPWRAVGVMAAVLYGSHLFVDYLTIDTRAPYGQPLLWPVSEQYWAMKDPPLMGIRHGSPNGGIVDFVVDLLSLHNLTAAVRELVALAPAVGFLLVVRAAVRSRSLRTPAEE
jgi:inner membrane protein